MALKFVGGKSGAVAGSTSSTPNTVALNSGLTGGFATSVASGDLIIVQVGVGHQARTPAPVVRAVDDTAYSVVGTAQNVTTDTQDIYSDLRYRFHDGTSNDDSVEIGNSGDAADGLAYAIHVWRGVDTGTPLDGVTPTAATGTDTGRPNPPSITPGSLGSVIIIAGAGGAATGANFVTGELQNLHTVNSPDTNDATVGLASYHWAGTSAFDPAAWTGGSTNANNSWAAKCLVLRAATADAPIIRSLARGFGTTTITVTKPSGTTDGDLLVGFVRADGGLPGTPSGFATGPSSTTPAICDVRWISKTAASEGADYTFTITGNGDAVLLRITGADTSSPFEADSQAATGVSSTRTNDGISLTDADSLAILFTDGGNAYTGTDNAFGLIPGTGDGFTDLFGRYPGATGETGATSIAMSSTTWDTYMVGILSAPAAVSTVAQRSMTGAGL